MSEARKTVGCLLKEKREDQGRSLKEVAISSRISEAYYGQIENGKRLPPPNEVMDRIISVLNFGDKEKDEIIRLSCYERQEIRKDLLEYMCVTTPASMRLMNMAMKKGLTDEYFLGLIRKLQLEDELSWVLPCLQEDIEE